MKKPSKLEGFIYIFLNNNLPILKIRIIEITIVIIVCHLC